MQNRMLVAIMIEYRSAAIDLKTILSNLSESEFSTIRDHKTTDQDCKSILTVVNHCIQSGYTYANYIDSITKDSKWLEFDAINANPLMAIDALDKMLDYTQIVLKKISHFTDKQLAQFQIKSRWEVIYDVEQLLEHAIVHILRHRLQVENFLNA